MIKSNNLMKLLLVPGGLFVTLILTCGFYNRFASDDFLIIAASNELSSMQVAMEQYFHWQGTFFISLFESAAFHAMQSLPSMLLFHMVTLGMLIHSMYFLIRNISERLKSLIQDEESYSGRPALNRLLLALILCSCFFFMSHDLGQQSWFLISGATRYLWPVILLLYAIAIALYDNMSFKTRVLLSSLLFFIYGFSTVNFVLITIFIYGLWLVYLFGRNWRTGMDSLSIIRNNGASIFPFVMLLLGAGIMVAAPGNYVRREEYDSVIGLSELLSVTFSSVLYFVKVMVKHQLIYGLLFILLFTATGYYAKNLSLEVTQVFVVFPLIAISVILASDLVHEVVMALAMGKVGPHRTYTLLSLLAALACAFLGFSIGNYLKAHDIKFVRLMYFAGVLGISVITARLLIEQYPIVKHYANEYDRQLEYLQDLNEMGENQGDTVYVSPLPQSGILYKFELAEKVGDPKYGITKAYEKINGLEFNIFVQDN